MDVANGVDEGKCYKRKIKEIVHANGESVGVDRWV